MDVTIASLRSSRNESQFDLQRPLLPYPPVLGIRQLWSMLGLLLCDRLKEVCSVGLATNEYGNPKPETHGPTNFVKFTDKFGIFELANLAMQKWWRILSHAQRRQN